MRQRLCAALFIVFLIGAAAAGADDYKTWRLGASYSSPTASRARDLVGSGFGVVAEYGAGFPEDDDDTFPGYLSVALSYARLQNTNAGVKHILDNFGVSMRWRVGRGASPESSGPYMGVGIGVAFLRFKPSLDGSASSERHNKGEASLFGGVNFSSNLYAELSYGGVFDVPGLTLDKLAFTMGIRF